MPRGNEASRLGGEPQQVDLANYNVVFDRVTFWRDKKGRQPPVFRDMSALLPKGRRLVVFGNKGCGKTMLVNLISGVAMPDRGRVYTARGLSWPFGSLATVDAQISVRANVSFFAGVFNLDFKRTYDFVCYFADHAPKNLKLVRELPNTTKQCVGVALSIAANHRCYLIDKQIPAQAMTDDRMAFAFDFLRSRDMIWMTSRPGQATELCDVAGVIDGGRLRFFSDVGEAYAIMQTTSPFVGKALRESEESDAEETELML